MLSPANKARILVVEDEALVARDIAQQLVRLGYEPVGHATRGEQAIVLAGELQPDLVLMDIQLAGAMDGIAAAQTIRQQFALPVVFLTALADDATPALAKLVEPHGCILKPFSERELRPVLELACYKHRMEARLRESEALTRALRSAIPDLIFTNRRNGEFLSVHASDPRLLFAPAETILHRTVAEVLPKPIADQFLQAFATAADSNAAQELPFALSAGGHKRLFLARVVPSAKDTVLTIVRDITARQTAEKRLQLQSAALEAAANAMVITNRDGVIEWANPAFTTITGYSLAEAVGRTHGKLLRSGVHKPAFYQTMWATIAAGNIWHGEVINRHKDGHLYTEDMAITPMKTKTGEITHFIAVKQDITRRKSLELQLFQSQKMEAIGLLAGGVAHDFNNIMAAVLIYLGMLQKEKSLGPETLDALQELETEVKRGAGVTRQLLTFSRQESMAPVTLNLNNVLVGLTKMLHRLLGEQITISHDRPEAPMLTDADGTLLEQVVINLCLNARDAMPRGGRLKLSVDAVVLAADPALAHAEARPGDFILLTVADSGAGMDPGTLQRIFEPFFTTKEMGKGTGLGLAIVHGIVKQHGGWIEVDSLPGKGTTFRVYLPASKTPAPTVSANQAPGGATPGHGETILLAEDDASLRRAIRLTLRRNGYAVIETSNGSEALEQWRQHRGQIALLITDMIMPGELDGRELADALHQTNPNLNVIVCTGYRPAGDAWPLAEDRRITLLRKPFDLSLLLSKVRQALVQT